MCHRARQCVEVSLHHGKIRRGGLCGRLSLFSVHAGVAAAHHGVFRRPRLAAESRQRAARSGAEGVVLASHGLDKHRGQLPAHDVLHSRGGLDAFLCVENGDGRPGHSGSGHARGLRLHAGRPRRHDVLGFSDLRALFSCVQLRPSQRHRTRG